MPDLPGPPRDDRTVPEGGRLPPLATALVRLEEALVLAGDRSPDRWRRGRPAEDVRAAFAAVGAVAPPEAVDWFGWVDGADAPGAVRLAATPVRLVSLEEAVALLEWLRALAADPAANHGSADATWPEDAVPVAGLCPDGALGVRPDGRLVASDPVSGARPVEGYADLTALVLAWTALVESGAHALVQGSWQVRADLLPDDPDGLLG